MGKRKPHKFMMFTGDHTRCIMRGEKTQTRRIMNPQPTMARAIADQRWGRDTWHWRHYKWDKERGTFPDDGIWTWAPCWPGDILWVREMWAPTDGVASWFARGARYLYKADYTESGLQDAKRAGVKWRASMRMPMRVTRCYMHLNKVWAERLWDITAEDCYKEGVMAETCMSCEKQDACAGKPWTEKACLPDNSIRKQYRKIWNTINAAKGHEWETNPWIWAYEFEKMDTAEAKDILREYITGIEEEEA